MVRNNRCQRIRRHLVNQVFKKLKHFQMFILILGFENDFAQESVLFTFLLYTLEDNTVSVKDCMEALRDNSKFSNYTGKSFLVKLSQGSNLGSFRERVVKHRV